MATKHNSVALTRAGDQEPIFVLRAQDMLAPTLVRQWADEAERNGCPKQKVDEARDLAGAMEQWPSRKFPD
jgi:hypothetical protein